MDKNFESFCVKKGKRVPEFIKSLRWFYILKKVHNKLDIIHNGHSRTWRFQARRVQKRGVGERHDRLFSINPNRFAKQRLKIPKVTNIHIFEPHQR